MHPHRATLARQYGIPPPARWILHHASGAWGWVPALERPYHEWAPPPAALAPPPGLRVLGVALNGKGRVCLAVVAEDAPSLADAGGAEPQARQ